MFGEEEFSLWDGPAELRLRVARFPTELDAKERALVDSVALLLRAGVEANAPEAVALARQLVSALDHPLAALREGSSEAGHERELEQLASDLVGELLSGRVRVERLEVASLGERDEGPSLAHEPPAKPAPEEDTTLFEARFVDEVGQVFRGIETELVLDGEVHELSTNAAGIALLENVKGSAATIRVSDLDGLEKITDERWSQRRRGKAPEESNLTRVMFQGGEVGPVPLKAAVPNTIVLEPPLGRLFVELWDKTGRTLHADCPYVIEGPERFEGRTDESGRLAHEAVLPGDYRLSLEQTIDLPDGPRRETLESQLLVLAPNSATPEVRLLGAVPRVELARIKGLLFDTNKSFLLPASTTVFERLQDVYREQRFAKLLIVGHTDTTAQASINDPLSLERADNTAAYLRDDVDAWLKMYEGSVRAAGRWGADEDTAMLQSLPDFDSKPADEDPLRWFQRTRGLTLDGIAGPETRRQLVGEYMALDGTSLASDEFAIELVTHGCGENFPLDEAQDAVDASPLDEQDDAGDRRVELFFFDSEFGILPPPPGKNSKAGSTEYPTWRQRATTRSDDTLGQFSVAVRLFDDRGEPLPQVDFELEAGDLSIRGQSDAEAFVRATLQVKAESGTLRWLKITPEDDEFELDTESGEFVFSRSVFLELLGNAQSEDDRAESTRRALHNLGYDSEDLSENVRHFQFDNDLEETGDFDDVRAEVLRRNEQGDPNQPS